MVKWSIAQLSQYLELKFNLTEAYCSCSFAIQTTLLSLKYVFLRATYIYCHRFHRSTSILGFVFRTHNCIFFFVEISFEGELIEFRFPALKVQTVETIIGPNEPLSMYYKKPDQCWCPISTTKLNYKNELAAASTANLNCSSRWYLNNKKILSKMSRWSLGFYTWEGFW